jgi:eukaryotic-like serine/threonine-protein kinase
MQQLPGQDGRYRPVRRIHTSGIGEVWEADDTLLGRRVAIKVLAAELAADPWAVWTFRREARASAKLDHPNIIKVLDVVTGETPLLVVELLEGQTLASRLRRGGAVPALEAAGIAAGVADGLDVAHRAGILHRDVRPSNVMLTAGGEVKVLGFGIAAAWEAHSTTGQQLLATATYAPPERIRGGRASPAGDLYALGVVLYELLTGRPPFVADTAEQLLRAHLEAAPRPVRDLVFWVPPGIAATCEAALAKDPARRPASAGALAVQLRAAAQAAQASADAFLSHTTGPGRPAAPTRRPSADHNQGVEQPPKPRRRSPTVKATAAVVVVLAAAGAAVAWWQANDDRSRPVAPPPASVVRQQPPRAASITVLLRYRARVWTRATVDGRLRFDGTATPGERRSWTARRSVELVLGNPTGVDLVVDDPADTSRGHRAQRVRVCWTPAVRTAVVPEAADGQSAGCFGSYNFLYASSRPALRRPSSRRQHHDGTRVPASPLHG